MLVLKNNAVLTNNNKVLSNLEITSLQVVNTNAFQFRVITTGPIRVYHGDDSYVDVPTKSTYYTITKTYSVVGTYNIVIANPENITALYFNSGNPWYSERINTNVSWFKQFYNLTRLDLVNTKFNGELGIIINSYLLKLNYISLYYTVSDYNLITINTFYCKNLWNNLIYCNINSAKAIVIGSLTDISFNVNITFIYLSAVGLTGSLNGIIKNGYTSLTYFYIYVPYVNTNDISNLINFENWIIPDTLTSLSCNGLYEGGILDNFNFKNLTVFTIVSTHFTSANLDNNLSFYAFVAKTNISLTMYGGGISTTPFIFNLSKFTGSYLSCFIGSNATGTNLYGDASLIYNNSLGNPYLTNSPINTLNAFGNVTFNNINGALVGARYLGITINADSFKAKSNLMRGLILDNLPNFTGDLSNVIFSIVTASYGIIITNCSNLYCNITTIIFGNDFYNNVYQQINLSYNPYFTGNLGNLTLWSNKSNIYLRNCAYTNIGGFVNNVFTQRNTCLKAASGVTNINVANNVDNNLLTGVLQRGSLGTYTGNQNDLTEIQIDNLANGLDYTGTGTSTIWGHKEKIWAMLNWKNSSTDNSSRYRLSSFSF